MFDNRFIVFIIILLALCIITPIIGHFFTDIKHTCLIGCPKDSKTCKFITYDINGNNKKKQMKKPCIFNGWNLSHLLVYMILTIIFPEYFIFLFIAGIIWEIFEIYFGVDNWLDILWNLMGIILGLIIV
jgi:hypothetical protein